MINMQIIKNEWKEHETCNSKCAFFDYSEPNECLLYANPCDWDMNKITKAFENMSAEKFNQMYDALMKKIIDKMYIYKKEGEDNERN